MTAPDVAVIGGGIVGTAAAALLAGAGARVRLYECEALAAGASGRNSGVVQRPFDAALVPLYEETVALYRNLAAQVEGGARLHDVPAGLLLVSRHAPLVRRLADELNAGDPGLGAEALEGPALRSLEPALAPDVVACRVPIGFPVPPGAGTYAFATLAERRGALIRLGRAAVPLVEGGRALGVVVEGRVERAGAVVVAAGPWTPALVDPTGRWRPIRPLWGVVVETELAGPPGHILEEAEMDAALGTGDLAAEAGAETDDPATTPEFSLVTAGGVSAVGSTFLDDEPDPEAWTERILRRGVRFVPGLLDAPIREVRACARPLSADGRPLIGAVPWARGLFVCSGHGPWGISTGPGAARLVADLVLGRPVTVPAAFDPGRFGSP